MSIKSRFLICLCITFFRIQAGELNLSGTNWKVKAMDNYKTYPAQVPGNAHTDLLRNGIIADPFLNTNEDSCKWVEEKTWVYETAFVIDKNILSQENQVLVCEGLDTYATVLINDVEVFQANNMFRKWTVDVKKYLRL